MKFNDIIINILKEKFIKLWCILTCCWNSSFERIIHSDFEIHRFAFIYKWVSRSQCSGQITFFLGHPSHKKRGGTIEKYHTIPFLATEESRWKNKDARHVIWTRHLCSKPRFWWFSGDLWKELEYELYDQMLSKRVWRNT